MEIIGNAEAMHNLYEEIAGIIPQNVMDAIEENDTNRARELAKEMENVDEQI